MVIWVERLLKGCYVDIWTMAGADPVRTWIVPSLSYDWEILVPVVLKVLKSTSYMIHSDIRGCC